MICEKQQGLPLTTALNQASIPMSKSGATSRTQFSLQNSTPIPLPQTPSWSPPGFPQPSWGHDLKAKAVLNPLDLLNTSIPDTPTRFGEA